MRNVGKGITEAAFKSEFDETYLVQYLIFYSLILQYLISLANAKSDSLFMRTQYSKQNTFCFQTGKVKLSNGINYI